MGFDSWPGLVSGRLPPATTFVCSLRSAPTTRIV
nr:MAG TPA: hypothetical protein [Caudoviricetes sp.]